jgi:hypothetical protein
VQGGASAVLALFNDILSLSPKEAQVVANA